MEMPRLAGPPSSLPRVLTYSTADVIDKRISVPAQHSLVRLSKNRTTNADAIGMLYAVKTGQLAGIYCVNWKIPAQRALKFGKSWWTIIPKDEDAILMFDPDNPSTGRPLIAFRRELSPDCGLLKGEKRFVGSPARLDAALLKVWRASQASLPVPTVPCRPYEGHLGWLSKSAEVKVIRPKLSFCQFFEEHPKDTAGFKNLAERQAKRIGAFAEPKLKGCSYPNIGSTEYRNGADIIDALEETYKCLLQPVDEVHIFGHSGPHGIFSSRSSKSWGLYVNDGIKCMTEDEHRDGARIVGEMPTNALAKNVVFLLHGCKTAISRGKGYCYRDRCVTRNGRKSCTCLCRLDEGPGIAEDLARVLVGSGLSEAKVFGHSVFGDAPGVIGRNEDWWVFSKDSPKGRRAAAGEVPY